jgi:hypothetical protein
VGLDTERLRRMSLARQFPVVYGRSAAAVVEVVRRIGPIQSQSPRAPFVALAARLPGVDYATIAGAFESYELIKNPTLRRTVHTVAREQFAYVDAVAERTAVGPTAAYLKLERVSSAEVRAETERYCRQWRDRDDLVRHVQRWLARHESTAVAARLDTPAGANHVWAHSAILRRPTDGRWERRTDTLHRAARELVDVPRAPADDALAELLKVQLAAYGPATRHDIAAWSGETLAHLDAATAALGEEVTRWTGADGRTYLDLAEPPTGDPPRGTRLLPEYDALVSGYAPTGRARFVSDGHRAAMAGRQHREYSPTVLVDGRVVATWRLVTEGVRRYVEITPLPGEGDPGSGSGSGSGAGGLDAAVAALGRALDVIIDDVVIVAG